MRLAITKWLVMAFVAFVFGIFVWDEVSEQRGRAQGFADAQRDLGKGQIGLTGLGKPMYWSADHKKLLADRYNVEYEHVAGCVASPYQHGYIFSYNETMKPALDKRSIDFDRLYSEAKSLAEARIHAH